MQTTDVLVIGSGGAGLSAAIEARRRDADVVILEAAEPSAIALGPRSGARP